MLGLGRWEDAVRLRLTRRQPCDSARLLPRSEINLEEVFRGPAAEWQEVAHRLEAFGIPNGTGGVNPGDRRAIYSLVRHPAPARILEVGTHLGASTVYIAAAMDSADSADGCHLTTVDVRNVNDPVAEPWR